MGIYTLPVSSDQGHSFYDTYRQVVQKTVWKTFGEKRTQYLLSS